jgi:hypothetical protein
MGVVLLFPATLNEAWFSTEPQLHVWDPDELVDQADPLVERIIPAG